MSILPFIRIARGVVPKRDSHVILSVLPRAKAISVNFRAAASGPISSFTNATACCKTTLTIYEHKFGTNNGFKCKIKWAVGKKIISCHMKSIRDGNFAQVNELSILKPCFFNSILTDRIRLKANWFASLRLHNGALDMSSSIQHMSVRRIQVPICHNSYYNIECNKESPPEISLLVVMAQRNGK